MKSVKRIISILLAVLMLATLSACGSSEMTKPKTINCKRLVVFCVGAKKLAP